MNWRLCATALLLTSGTAAAQVAVGRGGTKITVPEGATTKTVSMKNTVVDANGLGHDIYDFDVSICTANVAQKLKRFEVTDTDTPPETHFAVDDDSDEILDNPELGDENVDPPQTHTRTEIDGAFPLEPNEVFDVLVMLDQAAPQGGIQVQITPTSRSRDAYVFVPPIDGLELASVPVGSNDCLLLTRNDTGSSMSSLYVSVPAGVTIDTGKTLSPTFPTVAIHPSFVHFSGASVPNGSLIEAALQWNAYSAQVLLVSPTAVPPVPTLPPPATSALILAVLVAGALGIARRAGRSARLPAALLALALLQAMPLAQNMVKGGVKITIPNGSNSAVASYQNKTTVDIHDFDIAICTEGAAHKVKKVLVSDWGKPFADFDVDDDNDDNLQAGENNDDVDPPRANTRVESRDDHISVNDFFDISITLDHVAPIGGIKVQITPTDAGGDALVFVPPITNTELVSVPTGSNDARILSTNETGTTLTSLFVTVPGGVAVDPARTYSATFPSVNITPMQVHFSGAFVPNGSPIDAHVQWDVFSSMTSPQVLLVGPIPNVPAMPPFTVVLLAVGVLAAGALLSRK